MTMSFEKWLYTTFKLAVLVIIASSLMRIGDKLQAILEKMP